jgi:transcriptional regulator with XRE-family HTH domain
MAGLVNHEMIEARILRNIRWTIKHEGWTQRGLAKAVGMPENSLGRTLAGRRKLTAVELAVIADTLNVPADALVADNGI